MTVLANETPGKVSGRGVPGLSWLAGEQNQGKGWNPGLMPCRTEEVLVVHSCTKPPGGQHAKWPSEGKAL